MINQRELLSRITEAANVISQSSRKGSANYIIVGPSTTKAWYNINNFRIEKIRKIKRILKNG